MEHCTTALIAQLFYYQKIRKNKNVENQNEKQTKKKEEKNSRKREQVKK